MLFVWADVVDRYPRGDRVVVVVYGGSTIIDPTWELRLVSGTGLATREWDLGCINPDTSSFSGVERGGPDGLWVSVSGQVVEIGLDGETGRPDSVISAGC
ncbi:hypothetical protein ACFPM7_06495 [Actinokineospora guangxiensis]|uniref:Uncharacterized protein n=1 Tax=Actinokineospora guangxiensis TaxID=1490288 RepID=A0ABW0ELB3_9PSEU